MRPDEQGRHVVEYVEGDILMPFVIADPLMALRRVGRLLRDLHDAVQSFTPPHGAVWNVVIPPDRADLVIHHDAAPWNLVLGSDRWVLIDWDNAGPGFRRSRPWDGGSPVRHCSRWPGWLAFTTSPGPPIG